MGFSQYPLQAVMPPLQMIVGGWPDWIGTTSSQALLLSLFHAGVSFIHCMVVTIGLLKEFLSLSYYCRACTLRAVKTCQSGQPLDRLNFWPCSKSEPPLALDILGHSEILLDIMGLDVMGLDILGTTPLGHHSTPLMPWACFQMIFCKEVVT